MQNEKHLGTGKSKTSKFKRLKTGNGALQKLHPQESLVINTRDCFSRPAAASAPKHASSRFRQYLCDLANDGEMIVGAGGVDLHKLEITFGLFFFMFCTNSQ